MSCSAKSAQPPYFIRIAQTPPKGRKIARTHLSIIAKVLHRLERKIVSYTSLGQPWADSTKFRNLRKHGFFDFFALVMIGGFFV